MPATLAAILGADFLRFSRMAAAAAPVRGADRAQQHHLT
jgi:hypothetical protein